MLPLTRQQLAHIGLHCLLLRYIHGIKAEVIVLVALELSPRAGNEGGINVPAGRAYGLMEAKRTVGARNSRLRSADGRAGAQGGGGCLRRTLGASACQYWTSDAVSS